MFWDPASGRRRGFVFFWGEKIPADITEILHLEEVMLLGRHYFFLFHMPSETCNFTKTQYWCTLGSVKLLPVIHKTADSKLFR